jgi:hypothetical protein
MYFLIALICSLIGIGILIRFARPNYAMAQQPIIDTDQWIQSTKIILEKKLKYILRTAVVHLVSWYRVITRQITIHTTVRQKVRKILFEHYAEQKKAGVQKDHLMK